MDTTEYNRLRNEGSEQEVLAAFKEICRRALLKLPEDLRKYALECIIDFEPCVSETTRKEMDLDDEEELFGLYHGLPMTHEHHLAPPTLPARITLYYETLMDACETEEELIREIQVTLLHEIGHHFGMDEDQLEALGY